MSGLGLLLVGVDTASKLIISGMSTCAEYGNNSCECIYIICVCVCVCVCVCAYTVSSYSAVRYERCLYRFTSETTAFSIQEPPHGGFRSETVVT